MKNVLFTAFVALAVSFPLRAADVWRSKPVAEWTREETILFFRSSPWVRQGSVGSQSPHGQSSFSRSTFDGMPLSGQGCLSCAHVEPQAQQPRAGGVGGRSGATAATYLIQWTSARIVRQAFAHLFALQGQGVEDPDPAPLDVYVVSVGGVDLQAFEGIEEPELQREAWLRPKKSKAKVSASHVNILRGNDGRISVVHYGFPREQEGVPVIDEAEKRVEFRCRVRDKTLKTEFDLMAMVLQEDRDL